MTKNKEKHTSYQRRVYPLDAHDLTEEQIAVAFAMTSRRPEPFDEIAQQVSQEKAADFHERWVLGYGHASVAEHAVLHLAVENISRLACDTLEDNRLASYTEKSSRYQLMPQGYFHVPQELSGEPTLDSLFRETCNRLFQDYVDLLDGCIGYLQRRDPQRKGERDSAYKLRLRREATDSCRAVLPAATLTNVGVTANARVLEHAISKLMSSELDEERALGDEIRVQGRSITPTLIKYADQNQYLMGAGEIQQELALQYAGEPPPTTFSEREEASSEEVPWCVRLVHWDHQAEEKLAAALLYRRSHLSYQEIWRQVLDIGTDARREIIQRCVEGMGDHDAPVRELELVDYTFEFLLDYGAYREFKRHRMQSYIPQLLTVDHGYQVPDLMKEAGLESRFHETLGPAEAAYRQVQESSPQVAQYLVTHAHNRRVLSKMNLRECYHLFKLRTSSLAHFSIRQPMIEAMRLAVETHPQLFQYLKLREYPDWWPFRQTEGD
jgi:thymidylate synthase ThyX